VNTFHVYDSLQLSDYFHPPKAVDQPHLRITRKEDLIPAHMLRHAIVELHGEMKDWLLAEEDRQLHYQSRAPNWY
jgi:hypothetical protein